MAISASMVKELRDKTGAGMMDCKKALTETDGDMEKAVDWLRQKGLSKAAKRAGRATSEGLVGFAVTEKAGAMIEVQCETDFVARGEKFQEFTKKLTAQVMQALPESKEALLASASVTDAGSTIQDLLNGAISTIGENIQIGKFTKMELGAPGIIGSYLHSNGKIGVLVEVQTSEAAAGNEAFKDLAKNLAMQIAAVNPLAVDPAGLDPALVAREREVYREKYLAEGKPEKIVEKIVEGAVRKYYTDVCLLDQPYIRDDKMPISALVKATEKTIGAPIKVVRFVRIQLGA